MWATSAHIHPFFFVENSMIEPNHPPVVSIVGRSKSGKTTLIEKLIPILKDRGYRVGTIKHHAHPGFDIDIPGKDTWRHAQAGSDHVVIAAPDKIASIVLLEAPLDLPQILAGMQDVDIVLTDGYRRASNPKIEVLRASVSQELLCEPGELIALASDFELEVGPPRFDLDDAVGLVELILNHLLDRDT
jgi:molybdopterin-guanine dinucleotide biosynthesis protein MobB